MKNKIRVPRGLRVSDGPLVQSIYHAQKDMRSELGFRRVGYAVLRTEPDLQTYVFDNHTIQVIYKLNSAVFGERIMYMNVEFASLKKNIIRFKK